MNDLHQKVIAQRLEKVLIAFFVLSALFVVVGYVVAPSVYTQTLLFKPPPTDRYPLPATLFLFALLVFIAVLIVGILHHWRWLFWLLMIAFSFMILEIPATVLQLTGVLPNLFPVWYSLSRLGVAMITVVIAVWMIQIYRQYGVWAMGKKKTGLADPQ